MKRIILLLLLITGIAKAQTVPTTAAPAHPQQMLTNTVYQDALTRLYYTYNGTTFLWRQLADSLQVARMIGGLAPTLTFTSPLVKIGTVVSIPSANGSTNGYLALGDWTAFNNKQAAGNYITALTGDGTASGPGSAAFTLATVNSNIGTFNNLTVNGKGLVTAASNTSYQSQLNGTGFVKASGTSISYDNSTYVPTSRLISTGAGILGGGNLGGNLSLTTDTAGLLASKAWSLAAFYTKAQSNAAFQPLLGFTPENTTNKATSFGVLNNTLYPTTQAVSTLLGGYALKTGPNSFTGLQNTFTSSPIDPYTPVVQINNTRSGGGIALQIIGGSLNLQSNLNVSGNSFFGGNAFMGSNYTAYYNGSVSPNIWRTFFETDNFVIYKYNGGNTLLQGFIFAEDGSITRGNGDKVFWGTGTAGTVTSVSVVTANGISGTVATSTTTPAITLALGAITPTSVNGTTSTEIGRLSGVTSSVQTQLSTNAANIAANYTAIGLRQQKIISALPTPTGNRPVAGDSIVMAIEKNVKRADSIAAAITGLSGTYQPLENQRLSTTNSPTFAALNIAGTGGNGFIDLLAQSSPTATPAANHQLVYANALGQVSFKGSNGYELAFSKGSFTSSHVWSWPDVTDTVVNAARFRALAADVYTITGDYASKSGANTFSGTYNTFSNKVGIGGTNSTTEPFYITFSNPSLGLFKLQNTSSIGYTSYDLYDNSGTKQLTWGYANSGAGSFTASSYVNSINQPLIFATGNTERLRIGNAGLLTYTLNALGTTSMDGMMLTNTTAAAAGSQQYSPAINLNSNGWGTTAGTSQNTAWRIYNSPMQSSTAYASINLDFSLAGGAFATKYQFFTSQLSTSASITSVKTVGTTSTDAFITQNQQASTAGTPVQYSPRMRWMGSAWDTGTAASKTFNAYAELRPVSANPASSNFVIALDNGSGSYVDRFTLSNSGALSIPGSLTLSAAGNKINIATGSNASAGTGAVLVAGTVTVSTTAVTANSIIVLTRQVNSGTVGTLSYTRSAGTSFTITSSNPLDTSTVDWIIFN